MREMFRSGQWRRLEQPPWAQSRDQNAVLPSKDLEPRTRSMVCLPSRAGVSLSWASTSKEQRGLGSQRKADVDFGLPLDEASLRKSRQRMVPALGSAIRVLPGFSVLALQEFRGG